MNVRIDAEANAAVSADSMVVQLMMNIMLDTHIYDKIIDAPGLLHQLNELSTQGRILILSTHIQENELARVSEDWKRTAFAKIIRKVVATSGNLSGVSSYGWATFGDGSSGGFSGKDVLSPSRKHAKDALIATTAARDANVLVTEDKRLRNRMRTLHARCKTWTFDEFQNYVSTSNPTYP